MMAFGFGIRLFLCVLSLFAANFAIMSSARNNFPLSDSGNKNPLLGMVMVGRSLKVNMEDDSRSSVMNSRSLQMEISNSADPRMAATVDPFDYSEPKPNPGHDPLVPPASAELGIH